MAHPSSAFVVLYNIEAIIQESENLKNKFRSQINSVEDLVRFVFAHDVSNCEFGESEARLVAKEKVKELLGIEF